MLAGFAQEEERRLGIDRAHLVVFGLADLGDGFLQHLADGVDGDVRLAHRGDGVGEQLFHGRGAGEIALQRYRLGSGCLQRGDGGVGIGLARGAVVVDGDRLRAVGGEITGDQPAQVLAPPVMRTVLPLMEWSTMGCFSCGEWRTQSREGGLAE